VSGRAQGFDSQSSREFSLAAAEATPVVRGRPRSQDDAMEIARSLSALRTACAALRSRHASLALVPTMGALHAGHLALLDAAPSGAATVASIFVNPLQFGPTEDLSRYPRDEAGDLTKLEAAGCRLVWLPDVATMYPPGDATTIEMRGPAEGWEGAARPGHFRGVATVVARLFGQVRPDAACFGEKDWQQLQVVTRMVADLLLPVRIIGVPTVREPDGLAMSSRNRFLDAGSRAPPPVLAHVLHTTAAVLATGAPAEPALIRARAALAQAGFAVDYVALVDGPTLAPLDVSKPGARLIATARLGGVRLLDNVDAAGTAAVAALSASGV
jgi:pantoate--beta-alanine ligase